MNLCKKIKRFHYLLLLLFKFFKALLFFSIQVTNFPLFFLIVQNIMSDEGVKERNFFTHTHFFQQWKPNKHTLYFICFLIV